MKEDFEKNMERLEKIVRELERGDLPLEKALKLYEEGVTLSRRCESMLDKAELKIEKLSVSGGKVKAEKLDL
jgi:exodeoxyribonuclease VII small subunit